jgi:hypothetical protein
VFLILGFGWGGRRLVGGFRRGVVDGEGEGGGRADGDNARAEFDADCYVVVGREAAFAQADC